MFEDRITNIISRIIIKKIQERSEAAGIPFVVNRPVASKKPVVGLFKSS